MIDGSYQKTGLVHALAQLPKEPRSSLRDLCALFSGNKERTLLYERIEQDRLRLQQKVNSLSGQLNDLMTAEPSGAEERFRILRRLVNLRPSKINDAPLCDARHLDWQVCDSELEAHRGYLRLDDDYVVPKQAQGYVMAGLAVLILMAVMFSKNHAKPAPKETASSPLAASTDMNQRKIQELEQDLSADQRQSQQQAQAQRLEAGTPALPATSVAPMNPVQTGVAPATR